MSQERLEALEILFQIKKQSTPLQIQLKGKSPFVKELVYGVCRYYFRLEALSKYLAPKKIKDEKVAWIILLGLYQVLILDLPDYAVVKETVELAARLKKVWAKGLINAVLRRFCRERDEILKEVEQDYAYTYNHPEWLIRLLEVDWPFDWQHILKANDERAPLVLRVNTQKISRQNYLNKLFEAKIDASLTALSQEGIILKQAQDVESLPGFLNGECSVQDEAAQLAVSWLDLHPGQRVLDACCAPGGKTCHILEYQPHLKTCVGLDIDERRLERVKDNATRLGLHPQLIQGDATQPNTWWDGVCFDRILLDAPCSALGVIRRHPDIKILRTLEDIQEITKVQMQMLEALWPLLKKGGRLVYSTCSLSKREGLDQIKAFLKHHEDASLISFNNAYGHTIDDTCYILSGNMGLDGFFYAALTKI